MKILVIAYIVELFILVCDIIENIANKNTQAVAGYIIALVWCISAGMLYFKHEGDKE